MPCITLPMPPLSCKPSVTMKISVILALNFLVPAPGVNVPESCPSSILQRCDPLTYEDFRNVAKYHCYNPSIAWRRLVFQETSNICQGDCDSVVLAVPLRSNNNVEECGQHTCRRIRSVIEESCPAEEPSVMDAYDVAYRVSYKAPRPARSLFQRRLGAASKAVECQDTTTSVYYSIAIGVCSGLLTTAVLLWLYVFHSHLEDRRRRLRQVLQRGGDDSSSSKTSVVSSSDDGESLDTIPPTPPELYETSAARSPPAMVRRSSSRRSSSQPRRSGVTSLLDTISEIETRNGSLTVPSDMNSHESSPRGVEAYSIHTSDSRDETSTQPKEDQVDL